MHTILVIGSGGREHAIVLALAKRVVPDKIYCAPGNAGIGMIAENVPIKETEVEKLRDFALEHDVDLTIVGPEVALAAGIADVFRAAGLKIFGHSKAAARIETSKEFAKELMAKYRIPTAPYKSFTDYNEALEYVSGRPFPAVLKYDGLAAGKGVVIAENLAEADKALKSMLNDEAFGVGKVLVEDFLTGPEFSFMCFVRGNEIIPMPPAQDHKRAFSDDKGPNTGGMGAYTGLPFLNSVDLNFAKEKILQRTADAMVSEGCPLTGVLYGGLIKTPKGIKVIEFNARFGDPETEVVLPLLESDIYKILEAVASPDLPLPTPKRSDDVTMGVVLASKGYPGSYEKGFEIKGLDDVKGTVIHMGTALQNGRFVTNGGRVLMCVEKAHTIGQARSKAYEDVSRIKCPNLFCRSDIAYQAFENYSMVKIGTPLTSGAKKALLLGSGELGKEITVHLQRFGIEVIACDRYAHAPAMQVAHRSHVFNMLDGKKLRNIIHKEQPDFIIPEVEAIATPTLVELEKKGYNVIPTAKAAFTTMNRESIRRLAAEELGIPTTPYRFADTFEEFKEAVEQIGIPCVVKPVMSSSGHGQSTIKTAEDIEKAWNVAQKEGRAGAGRVIIEKFVDFDYEITLLTVRHSAGTTTLEPIGHHQVGGDYRESWQPQPMSEIALEKAKKIAIKITGVLGGYGIFGVELFIKGDDVIFSEVSPRPHDTGMVTMISQDQSEFALHVSALLGLPIPKVRFWGPSASKAIVVEGDSTNVEFGNLEHVVEEEGVQIRLFGKPEVHGHRRFGVILAIDETVEKALAKVERAYAKLEVKLQ